jgi:DNA repair exonuclease SbcCD ATPase subunit
LKDLKSKVDKLKAEFALAERQLTTERSGLRSARRDLEVAQKARGLLQTAAQRVQQRAHKHLATLVTRCIRAVYQEDDYEFRIEFERKRGKTSARLVFLKNKVEEDPSDGSGGGIVDLASLALRIACLCVQRPARRRLLVLDEPFKWINGEVYQQRTADLLEALAEELDFQLLIVTDDEWLKIGTVIELD